jgi:N-acetylated-alpha-linked acidic dipeptidase
LGTLLDARARALADRFEGQSRTMQAKPVADPALTQRLIQAWLDPAGLEGRPWFRNTLAASDRDSGYAAWVLPGVQAAVVDGGAEGVDRALLQLERVADRIDDALAGRP